MPRYRATLTLYQRGSKGLLHVRSGAQVTVYEADGVTLLAQTLYDAPTGGAIVPNPVTLTIDGTREVYVDLPQRAVYKAGGESHTVEFQNDQSLAEHTALGLMAPSSHTTAAHNSLAIAHGSLSGLTGDDHTQYHTDARGDARYSPLAHTHTQAQSHNTPDTDTATTALHHTLGTGANQAAAGSHIHDDRYYTEAETTTLLAGKSDTSHTHTPTLLHNLLVNPGFEQWQRGNGPFTTSTAYSADRWRADNGGTATHSILQDSTAVDTGSRYAVSCTVSSASGTYGTGDQVTYWQIVEDWRQLRGKTVTFTLRVMPPAGTTGLTKLYVNDGATESQSAANLATGAYETLTVTHAVSASAAQLHVGLRLYGNGEWRLDNAVLVIGSTAPAYVPLHPADDLARCERYYEKHADGTTDFVLEGYGGAGNNIQWPLPWRQTKPVSPTMTKNGTWNVNNTSQPGVTGGTRNYRIYLTATTTGMARAYSDTADDTVTGEANP